MAKTYKWPNGTSGHSIPWDEHVANVKSSNDQKWLELGQGSLVPQAPQAPFAGVDASNVGGLVGSPSLVNPPPTATAQPVDPYLESARLSANRNVAISKGNAAYATGNLGFDYGYNPDGTPNAANPYSRAALYTLDYEHRRAGTRNSLAAQGQLYSGAYGRAQDRNDRNYAMNDANNRLGYQRGLHGIQAGQLGAFANAGTGVSDADFNALLKATYPGS